MCFTSILSVTHTNDEIMKINTNPNKTLGYI